MEDYSWLEAGDSNAPAPTAVPQISRTNSSTVREDDTSYVYQVPLPAGTSKADVRLQLNSGWSSFSVVRREGSKLGEERESDLICQMKVPKKAQVRDITARYDRGSLVVIIPKKTTSHYPWSSNFSAPASAFLRKLSPRKSGMKSNSRGGFEAIA